MIQALLLAILLPAAAFQQPAATQPDAAPYEGDWIVDVIDNVKVMPTAKVTVTLTRTRISGLASCNSYQGGFTVTDHDVKVGELIKTMKACDGATMSQETDFLDVLRRVVRYEVTPKDTLRLITANSKEITATRAPAR